ncbi:hypothetical protein RB280 [Rhodopirellula baltica SH 1]|uniref:Uncharacterized protein n=1 Tax=Rhodopirellula baltica (strain DSM 10527 / NCIMB 13988 / SH1) TaxID=243090 RepID=Q7UZ04_RHOBA|nr:hypothetical protein RB280 [Rhodopirellula baltica SH 1]
MLLSSVERLRKSDGPNRAECQRQFARSCCPRLAAVDAIVNRPMRPNLR